MFITKKLIQHDHDEISMVNMRKVIETIRGEIRDICARMFYSGKQMNELDPNVFGSNEFSEDLLQKHQVLLNDLQFKFNKNSRLFKKMEKFINLEKEMNELTQKYREINNGNEFTVYGLSLADYLHTKQVYYKERDEMIEKAKNEAERTGNTGHLMAVSKSKPKSKASDVPK